MKTVQDLASEAAKCFVCAERPNGDKFWKLRTGSPEWVHEVVKAAHDNANILPDDYRYEFARDAIEALAEFEDEDAARDAVEPDVYTRDLARWLASSAERVDYLTQALQAFGERDGFRALATAQYLEKIEVFDAVLAELRARSEAEEQVA